MMPNCLLGGESILSQEGTTQGDPLAMAMYASALVPMITRLSNVVKQVWYTDDVAAEATLLMFVLGGIYYVISALNLIILSIHPRLF